MRASGPVLQSVASAVPPFVLDQAAARDFAAALFGPRYARFERYLPVFENSRIEQRYLSRPLDWFRQPRAFEEANRIYRATALDLAEEAAETAIARAGIARDEIGMLIFVSTSGIATPSLDAALIQRLGLPAETRRLPIWGLGCAGGVAGLARAAELAGTMPGRSVLLIAVELCSLTFQHGDWSKSNLIATALFGDGAAALTLRQPGPNEGLRGLEILGSHSQLFDDSEDLMGWDLVASGLKVRFARSIPALVKRELPALVRGARSSWGLAPETPLRHFVAHPGGAKVLQAYRESLALDDAQLAASLGVLRDYGNMSSPTVLFALERFLETTPASDALGLMLALGPGFCAEQLLFRW